MINYYLKLQIEKDIEHSSFKYGPSLSSHTEHAFYNPNTNETVILHAGTNLRSQIFLMILKKILLYFWIRKTV